MKREAAKIALITGSSRGIGRAAAVKLVDAGIFTYINYHQNETAARQVLAEIRERGGEAELCPFDVAGAVFFLFPRRRIVSPARSYE